MTSTGSRRSALRARRSGRASGLAARAAERLAVRSLHRQPLGFATQGAMSIIFQPRSHGSSVVEGRHSGCCRRHPHRSRATEGTGKMRALIAFGSSRRVARSRSDDRGAWAWDPNVTLQGGARCGVPAATWVYVSASNGEHGWATYGAGHYLFQFHNVGSGGISVHVTYGEAGASCHDDLASTGRVGALGQPRNVIRIVPNG